MSRSPIRLLTDAEKADFVDASSASLLDLVADLSSKAAAEETDPSSPFRFLNSVLAWSIQSIGDGRLTSPQSVWPNPSAMSESEAAVLQQLADVSRSLEVRARFADFVWLRSRDWKYGELAARAYLASASSLMAEGNSTSAAPHFARAAKLAVSLGRRSAVYGVVIGAIESCLTELEGTDVSLMSCRLMTILLDLREGDGSRYAALAENIAIRAEAAESYQIARVYWNLAVKWFVRLHDVEGERRCRIAAAETLVKESERPARDDPPKFGAASLLLSNAIMMLKKAGADQNRIDEATVVLESYKAKAAASD